MIIALDTNALVQVFGARSPFLALQHSFYALTLTLAFGRAQGEPFRNLGFDEADTNKFIIYGDGSGGGSTADVLSGWQLYHGTELRSVVAFNWIATSSGFATLVDRNAPLGFPPEGPFAMLFEGTQQGTVPFSLVQQGDVPSGGTLLRLRYAAYPFTVSLNGTNILPTIPAGVPIYGQRHGWENVFGSIFLGRSELENQPDDYREF